MGGRPGLEAWVQTSGVRRGLTEREGAGMGLAACRLSVPVEVDALAAGVVLHRLVEHQWTKADKGITVVESAGSARTGQLEALRQEAGFGSESVKDVG